MKIIERPRRLRRFSTIRDLVEETRLLSSDFVWPVFLQEGEGLRDAIPSMPDCARLSLDELKRDLDHLVTLGLKAIALFPCIEDQKKSSTADEAHNPNGLIPRALRELKRMYPELLVITDVALDPYSSDGHDGLVRNGEVVNDETLVALAKQSLMQAEAGADFIAPSDMMDGRVGFIRQALDESGFSQTGIISYTAKYASAFYGPFREALASAPRFGDKKTYQMNPANRREAQREARLDQAEGADVLLVKPALAYLDVIADLRAKSDLPIAAYNVSGEYAMVKAVKSLLEEQRITFEILTSIKRAGADMIFSYHTPQFLKWMKG